MHVSSRVMKSDPDKFLNQLVVAALTVFVLVIMLLAAFVLRHLWLQQRIADLSSDVQVRLDDLEEITEEMQRELDEIQVPSSEAESLENLEEVTAALDDVDEQLNAIEGNLGEVAIALEPQPDVTSAFAADDRQPAANQDQIDEVFTIFAILIGIASIAIAILLGMAVRVQQSTSYSESHQFPNAKRG